MNRTQRTHLVVGIALFAALAGGAASGLQAPGQDLTPRVSALEAELVQAGRRIAELEQRAERLEGFVAAVSRSSSSLAATLEASEAAGFTAGINPRSREILLSGWRAHLDTLRGGLPQPPAPEPQPPPRR